MHATDVLLPAGLCGLGAGFFQGFLLALGFLRLALLVVRQLLLLVQFFQAFFFALGFLLLGLFLLQAFLFLLLQPFAALVFLALTLAFFAFELLLAFFLFLFQALFLALDGDVGFAGVWLCLPWWGRRGRDRRGFGRLGLRRGRGRRGLNSPGRRLLRHGRPQFGLHSGHVGAAFPVHAPGQGCNQNRMRQHGQRNGAQACRWAGRGKLVAVVVGVHAGV